MLCLFPEQEGNILGASFNNGWCKILKFCNVRLFLLGGNRKIALFRDLEANNV
jgi:hypothetical protein